jgi:hypothetical protein
MIKSGSMDISRRRIRSFLPIDKFLNRFIGTSS